MKKKLVIIISFAIVVIYSAAMINNFMVGQKILGPYTSFKAKYLNVRLQKRDIKPVVVSSYLADSINDQTFSAPKIDTVKTFRIKGIYRSFKFKDSACLVIIRDTGRFDIYKSFMADSSSGNQIVKDYLAEHKITSEYQLLRFVYDITPNDITVFNPSRSDAIIKYTLLKLKDLTLVSEFNRGLYRAELRNINIFQYGAASENHYSNYKIYMKSGAKYTMGTKGLSQDQIDYVLNSFDQSNRVTMLEGGKDDDKTSK